MKLGELLRSGDWKNEKHVPVIDAPDSVQADQPVEIGVSVGADIPHPNTAEHHIRWIRRSLNQLKVSPLSWPISSLQDTEKG